MNQETSSLRLNNLSKVIGPLNDESAMDPRVSVSGAQAPDPTIKVWEEMRIQEI